MAKLPSSFDSRKHDDMQNLSAFEVKKAPAQLIKSSMEDTNDKQGKYLKLEFKVLDGKYKGNHVWTQLNLVNKSEKAVEIANKELATICRACGKPLVDDSQELHGIPILIDTRIKPGNANYPAKTEIAMYYPMEGEYKAPSEEASSGDEPASGGKKKPWD